MALALVVAIILLLRPFPKVDAGRSPVKHECTNFMLPVTATSRNAVYDILPVDSTIGATAFAVDYDTRTRPIGQDRIIRNITVSRSYKVNAQLCVPPNGIKKDHLQIATHGAVFDRRYWNVRINPSEYSYVDAALAAGYSILTYDRLGTGSSDKPNAYTTLQVPFEIEVLRSITETARSGKLLEYASRSSLSGSYFTDKHTNFKKFIHLGHSLGSVLTAGLLGSYGNLSDAAVITGFLIANIPGGQKTTALGFDFAHENDPKRFARYGSGYIVPRTASGLQTGFFSSRIDANTSIGGFEPELLEYADRIKQPLSVGEWASFSAVDFSHPASDFTGPIQFFEAEHDFLLCQGDCNGIADRGILEAIYINAKDIDLYMQPGTGHGLTMHRNASMGYQVTLNWLSKNGL